MLGDENNNELFDLANFDAKKTALLVIDELGAVLGQRTSRELIRTGAEKAFVSATFSAVHIIIA